MTEDHLRSVAGPVMCEMSLRVLRVTARKTSMAKLIDRRFRFFFLIGSGACVAVGADDNDYDGEPNYCFRFSK